MASCAVAVGLLSLVALGRWLDARNEKLLEDDRTWNQLTEAEQLARVLQRVK
jgi:hypothetical protein